MTTDDQIVTSLENTYWLTGVEGRKGTYYLFDDNRQKICILPGERVIQLKVKKREKAGFILDIGEALQMAREIQQIAAIYFGQFKGYQKVDLELTRKKRKQTAPQKGR